MTASQARTHIANAIRTAVPRGQATVSDGGIDDLQAETVSVEITGCEFGPWRDIVTLECVCWAADPVNSKTRQRLDTIAESVAAAALGADNTTTLTVPGTPLQPTIDSDVEPVEIDGTLWGAVRVTASVLIEKELPLRPDEGLCSDVWDALQHHVHVRVSSDRPPYALVLPLGSTAGDDLRDAVQVVVAVPLGADPLPSARQAWQACRTARLLPQTIACAQGVVPPRALTACDTATFTVAATDLDDGDDDG